MWGIHSCRAYKWKGRLKMLCMWEDTDGRFCDGYEGGAYKPLSRPGKKQATATKLGIFSTYSPRNLIHFLARCYNFCKALKKKKNCLSVHPVLRGSNDFRVGRKMTIFHLFFSVQGTGGSPTGPDPENRVGEKDIGSPGRPVSSQLQVPGEPGHCGARTRPLWWPSRGVFPPKCPSIAPAEMSNNSRWSFGTLEDNQWGGCRLDLKKIEARTFPADFCTRKFLGRGEPLCCHWLLLCHQSWQKIIWITPKKFQKLLADYWHCWHFWSAFRHFGTHFVESFCMSKSSWMMDPTCSHEMPGCSAIDLAKIRRSSKCSSWISSIISGVVTVLGHPGWGASQVEKSPHLNWATQFLMVSRWCIFP